MQEEMGDGSGQPPGGSVEKLQVTVDAYRAAENPNPQEVVPAVDAQQATEQSSQPIVPVAELKPPEALDQSELSPEFQSWLDSMPGMNEGDRALLDSQKAKNYRQLRRDGIKIRNVDLTDQDVQELEAASNRRDNATLKRVLPLVVERAVAAVSKLVKDDPGYLDLTEEQRAQLEKYAKIRLQSGDFEAIVKALRVFDAEDRETQGKLVYEQRELQDDLGNRYDSNDETTEATDDEIERSAILRKNIRGLHRRMADNHSVGEVLAGRNDCIPIEKKSISTDTGEVTTYRFYDVKVGKWADPIQTKPSSVSVAQVPQGIQ